jgi:hypothetical protein
MSATSRRLHVFYEQPDPDRWLPLDRYPRRVVRRVLRGPRIPGGQERVFLNLCAGLDRLGVGYRINDYRSLRRDPGTLACVIGKPFVLDEVEWRGPILFGPAVHSHPSDDPQLLERLPVARVLVPGEWMRRMCAEVLGDLVHAWPVGIDTEAWTPTPSRQKDIDVLLYDKVLWNREECEATFVAPIRAHLLKCGLRVASLRYGTYREDEFHALLARSRAMIFLCEHETQGIAYQQALSAGVPILAWDPGGVWRDPAYYPHRVVFGPVSSVPYWDARCGLKFEREIEFEERLAQFLTMLDADAFAPRDFVLEHLTLEKCATEYLKHVAAAETSEESQFCRADHRAVGGSYRY